MKTCAQQWPPHRVPFDREVGCAIWGMGSTNSRSNIVSAALSSGLFGCEQEVPSGFPSRQVLDAPMPLHREAIILVIRVISNQIDTIGTAVHHKRN